MAAHQDEVESVSHSSDVSSQSDYFNVTFENSSSSNAKRKRLVAAVPNFYCVFDLKEDHGCPMYDCAFNPYLSEVDCIFAAVGSCRATIYRCSMNGDGTFKPIYCFVDPDDDIFYGCAWLYDVDAKSSVLAFGGKRGVIHLVSFNGNGGVSALCGHGQAVNELVTHPVNSCLLLSGSKDNEVRLWNIKNRVCIAIFGGADGHKSEVLSCDFDMLGERIVSGGMDHSIKIWSVLENHRVDKAVQQSKTFIQELNPSRFPTVKVSSPDFTTRDVHKNYVDCVRWFGDTLISKSCENQFCHWKPGSRSHVDYSKDETNVCLLNKCRIPSCSLWFVKFAIDQQYRWLATGNQFGKIYVWDLNAMPAQPKCLQHSKCTTTIRKLAFSPNGEDLIAVCDDATIWRWSQKKRTS